MRVICAIPALHDDDDVRYSLLFIQLTVTFMVILQALSMMMMKKVANSCPSNKYDVNPTTSSILLFLYPFASFIFTVLSTLPLLVCI